MSAIISPCGTYRYLLRRPAPVGPEFEQPCLGTALFVMLNPSTADATADDPTVRRCKAFAYRWGCNGIAVVNLYALRSPSPADLWRHADPVGPDNDMWLRIAAREHETVIFAWGANSKLDRVREVYAIFCGAPHRRILSLGTTKDGSPRHPLYVRADQRLTNWSPAQ
ncbi:hypothetical protein HDG34_007657 [Paraburkholderia sp. HC6.4b]|uniref:DUF1643 domain-containing protein n=1 Tax=unclassified Paraburkholderia TaxID=2615204 RepID=UPI001617D491|nr:MULTISPECIES: DUF1643 domain-containing protein [unclassified Paraburkholderia]MBB5413679.1 hypothetical protein [Paraburkholderia sp. HC6.4b]MBB5456090.1 hypothetical protein [Paraburkholderia sp. Kb1A]